MNINQFTGKGRMISWALKNTMNYWNWD